MMRRPGTMIAVVGPSGVGKDSLIGYAAERLAARGDIGFVRRWITRPADAGGEDHRPVDEGAFAAMAAAGRFAVAWRAHGLAYGVDADTVPEVAAGRTLVVNGSRGALADFVVAYGQLAVVRVTARREVLAARLAARGRESAADILARLDRPEPPLPGGVPLFDIDNSGALAVSGRRFVDCLAAIADTTP